MVSIFWFADGAGTDDTVPRALIRWIRTQSPALVIYGGDVYGKGTDAEFARFFEQMGRNVSDLCEVAGNHDWDSPSGAPFPDRIPTGYENFWRRFPPPASHQPIDTRLRGGARYDHVKDLAGWRLVFVDTGPCNDETWPVGDPERPRWLRRVLTETPGRAKIVFAHHSRLSRGKHGDNDTVDPLWQCLFDEQTGAPRAALTVGGHDHNVTWYDPRPKSHPDRDTVAFDRGIFVHVNGAGGHGHDETSGGFTGFLRPISGTTPQFADDDHWCVTRIDLLSESAADVSILSFGADDPPRVTEPTVLKKFELRL
ncbi:MAG: metallophosphoesterase [Vicinamibacterales bacterium]